MKRCITWAFKKDQKEIQLPKIFIFILPTLLLSYFVHIANLWSSHSNQLTHLFRNYYSMIGWRNYGAGNPFNQVLFDFRKFTLTNPLIIIANLIFIMIIYGFYRKRSIRILFIANLIMFIFVGIRFLYLSPLEYPLHFTIFTPWILFGSYFIYIASIIYFIYHEIKELVKPLKVHVSHQ